MPVQEGRMKFTRALVLLTLCVGTAHAQDWAPKRNVERPARSSGRISTRSTPTRRRCWSISDWPDP